VSAVVKTVRQLSSRTELVGNASPRTEEVGIWRMALWCRCGHHSQPTSLAIFVSGDASTTVSDPDRAGASRGALSATSDEGRYSTYLTEERESGQGPQQRRRREDLTQ
jgi:hypothetical protein